MSTSEVSQKKLRQIRALLAKAEDPGVTEAEALALSEKAFALIAAYGIEEAMLESSGPNASAVPEMRTIIITPPWALDSATLLANLAAAFRCKTVRIHRADKRIKEHHVRVFGYPSDLDRLDMVYTSLLIQMHSGVLSAPIPYLESTKSFRKGWLVGWIVRVIDRVKTAEDHARKSADPYSGLADSRESSSGTEIVLANREATVAALVSKTYPNLQKGKVQYRSSSGFKQGHQDGSNADIGQARMTGRRAIGR